MDSFPSRLMSLLWGCLMVVSAPAWADDAEQEVNALRLPASRPRTHRGLHPEYADRTDEEVVEMRGNTTLGGPITLLVVGSGLFAAGVGLVVYASTVDQTCASDYPCGDSRTYPTLLGVAGGLAGLGMGIPGAILLPKRLDERSKLDNEIQFRERSNTQSSSFLLVPLVTPTSATLGLRLQF